MTDEMLSEGLLTTLIVDNPLAQGPAALVAAPTMAPMAKPTMAGDRSKLTLLAMPGVTAGGPEVARLLEAISAAGSWKAFTTRSIAARVPESQAIRHKPRPIQMGGVRSSEQQGRIQGGHALALAHVGGGDSGAAAGNGEAAERGRGSGRGRGRGLRASAEGSLIGSVIGVGRGKGIKRELDPCTDSADASAGAMDVLAGDSGSGSGPGAHGAGGATGAGGSLFDVSSATLPPSFDFPSDGRDLDGIGQLQLRFGYV